MDRSTYQQRRARSFTMDDMNRHMQRGIRVQLGRWQTKCHPFPRLNDSVADRERFIFHGSPYKML